MAMAQEKQGYRGGPEREGALLFQGRLRGTDGGGTGTGWGYLQSIVNTAGSSVFWAMMFPSTHALFSLKSQRVLGVLHEPQCRERSRLHEVSTGPVDSPPHLALGQLKAMP